MVFRAFEQFHHITWSKITCASSFELNIIFILFSKNFKFFLKKQKWKFKDEKVEKEKELSLQINQKKVKKGNICFFFVTGSKNLNRWIHLKNFEY